MPSYMLLLHFNDIVTVSASCHEKPTALRDLLSTCRVNDSSFVLPSCIVIIPGVGVCKTNHARYRSA